MLSLSSFHAAAACTCRSPRARNRTAGMRKHFCSGVQRGPQGEREAYPQLPALRDSSATEAQHRQRDTAYGKRVMVGLVMSFQNPGNLNLHKKDFIVEDKIQSHAGRSLELPSGTRVSEGPSRETHSTDVAQIRTSLVTEFKSPFQQPLALLLLPGFTTLASVFTKRWAPAVLSTARGADLLHPSASRNCKERRTLPGNLPQIHVFSV